MGQYDYEETVRVFWAERYDGPWMPGNLSEAIAWLQEMLGSVPEQYRDCATIEIDSVGSWENSHYASIRIEYRRPATEAEIKERKDEQRKHAEHDLEWAKRRIAEEEARLASLAD